MKAPMFDVDALVAQFESASARHGKQLEQLTAQATLAALQQRELSLKNIRGALRTVAEAAGTGAAQNRTGADVVTLIDHAVAGMDQALLQAVAANRVALEQLQAQGADLHEKHLKKALGDLEKFEDTLYDALKKAATGAAEPVADAWRQTMEKMQAGGTRSGLQANETLEQLGAQMQSTIRQTRAAGMRAAQALAQSYTALASGVLIGMAQALTGRSEPASKPDSSE
jgi:hypothetical protein